MLRLIPFALLGLTMGACLRLADEPKFNCDVDSDCPSGDRCSSWVGKCVARDGCYAKDDCAGGQFCFVEDYDPYGYTKTLGTCKVEECDPYIGGACGAYRCDLETHSCNTACTSQDECEPGATCRSEGRCANFCNGIQDCEEGEWCADSFCEPSPCRTLECGPYACSNQTGQCKTQCTRDGDCAADASCTGSAATPGICRVPTCSEGCGNYACGVDSVTCLGSCKSDGDCIKGSSCVANECRVPCVDDTPCGNYTCAQSGVCKMRCNVTAYDCREGYTCNDSKCVR